GQVNDIAVEQDRHAELIERPGRVAGREALERKGYRIEERRRQGDHEEEKEQWEGEHAEDVPTQMEKDQPHEHDNQRAPHQKVLCTEITQEERADPREEHRESDPAPFGRQRRKLLAALPDEESTEKRHQEAVRVVRVVPPLPG